MKIHIKGLIMICALFATSIRLSAQTVMNIADGGKVYIQQNASVSLDSLVLTPSADILLSANNISKSAMVAHAATGNYVSRVYNFSTPVVGYAGSITIVYKDNELNGLNENGLVLEAFTNNKWQPFTNNVIRNTTDNFVTTTGLSTISLDELTLACETAVLPLQWISVEATRGNGVTYLKWTTTNEVSSKYYQAQKSNNAETWTNIGNTVAASNHSALNNYNFTDAAFLNGTVYYRIVQMDASGKLSYSSIVSVKNILKDDVSIYPIPAISIINIRANDNTTMKRVKLFDAAGKLLMMKEGSNSNVYSFNISGLAIGFYLISIETNNGKITKTFMKK